ncbi:MAG: DNA/RNA non-specific endonuclease [Muribaculaceae bacterium]|nr:DNA/RNA non-specific endonuclease [Muribaculaceae bacterium]
MKRNNKKSSNLFDLAKTTVKTALWIVIVFALIFLLGRFIYNDLYPAPKIEVQANGLTDVKLPVEMKNVVCHYSGFTSYFNPETHIPNCVAYEIIESETTGDEPRKKSFEADHTIDGCAESSDYRNSGYDRGHMAPAADMKWSKEAMEESFLMTNICPQVKSLNSGIWHRLEQRVREWAARDSSIIVVCGPIFTPGKPVEQIGEIGVAVPHRFFKALYAPGRNIGIAFIFDNDKVKGELRKYAVTIDSVERETGLDLFYNLPDDIENEVENQCNYKLWEKR